MLVDDFWDGYRKITDNFQKLVIYYVEHVETHGKRGILVVGIYLEIQDKEECRLAWLRLPRKIRVRYATVTN